MNLTDGGLQIVWQDITVDVMVTYDWLNTDYHHLELRADQALPLTTTGYCSHFIPMDQLGGVDRLGTIGLMMLQKQPNGSKHMKNPASPDCFDHAC